ncbi:MAG: MFS transporter [Bacillales bacterium]|jgi:fucose permease|nr:MFS transporter [Bacillales bacterium]
MIFLLVIIYISFISLGLPDAILGSAWPMIHLDINAQLASAGIISLIVSLGTLISGLLSSRLILKLKIGKVTLISTLLTSFALLGFSFSNSLWQMCLLAFPLGLGAGTIDAALNNYVSLHYKARHMNWLHSFWGVGATLGPIIMSFFLGASQKWRSGYRIIFLIQITLAIIMFFSLPLWHENQEKENKKFISNKEAFLIKGVKFALLGFITYCGYEQATGLWTSSYLVTIKGLNFETSALWVSLFYIGISLGRILSGFLSIKVSSLNLVRYGCMLGIIGVIFLFLPSYFCLVGLILIGLGASPYYPQMMHETPKRFGELSSSAVMGLQMASASLGVIVLPPLIGLLTNWFSLMVFPITLLILEIIAFICNELVTKICKKELIENKQNEYDR